MTEPHAGIVVGVLGQWASGKTEAARTLIRHLGGEGKVVFLTDRALFASQAVKHVLELEVSEVVVSVDDDGRQRLDSELVTVWLAPGEDLRSVEPSTLRFDVYDDEILLAFRKRAKVELGYQIRERAAGGKPVVVEAAFGPNPEQAGENPYGRTIAELFARLERAGVKACQVKWIIVEASCDTRAERNAKRLDRIPVHYFERFAADGGDLAPDHERRLVEQGTLIRRVPNDHDDVDRFRADILAAFEDMFGDDSLESRVNGRRERG
jgi:hypothetical protein